jgi:succinate dehydrogenase/fumarate reductase-like Fe-S protein
MTNNKQQTAVEWLVKELNQKIDFIPLDKWDMIRDIIQQAKEMEKEQMIDFAVEFTYGTKRVGEPLKKDFIKLYNKTYGGGEQ